MGATGFVGAAAITTALAALGPFGIVGDIATLIIMAIISDAIVKFGFDAVYTAVIKELIKRGESKMTILAKVENYPISKDLKRKLRECVEKAV